ncbi:hypothetical protein Ocin01_05220 [Orchesella cincta]|uniref:Uncharacterized protein n=1 Tax=Orchesella cincta TaxID=48709 RepID=A0A1D2N878_ORCCI|nr:hypothetical protein Ocin01_05220 [Orchesella cincta]
MDSPRRVASGTPKSSPQQGNLTGPARVLNDVVVSFYNSIQKWNEAYLSSVRVIQSIQSNNGDEDQIQSSCEKLGSLVDVMRFQSNQLQALCFKFTNLKALNNANLKIGVSWTSKTLVIWSPHL